MKHLVEIYFPIIGFHIDDNLEVQKNLTLKEIEDILKTNTFNLDEFIIEYDTSITIQEPNPEILIYDPAKPFLHTLSSIEKSLKITINLIIDLNLFVVSNNDGRITDEKELLKFLPYSITDTFGDILFEILLLAQIARPCGLRHREGIIYFNKRIQSKIVPTFELYQEQLELQKEHGYPKLEYLRLTDLYSWIYKNHLLFPERPKNSFDKALNNLSFVNGEENDISIFIYLMRTLEEIYTNNIHQVSDQLNKNIQLFLGPMETFKKQIKNMYNIRSRFLHGDTNLPPYHKRDYVSVIDFPEGYENEIFEATSLSLTLIISTLQKMYSENRKNINFKYVID